MTQKILKNNNKLLDEMMSDLHKQDKLYKPGNYWTFYEKGIIRQIKKNSLSQFRSWSGSAGIGNIQSFGGGTDHLVGRFGAHFHPFDNKFINFDNNFFIKAYNFIINKLSKYFSFLSFFSFRAAEARRYFDAQVKKTQNLAYDTVYNLDKDLLLSISDSQVGNPSGFYRNDKFYTIEFLDFIKKISFIKKNTDFENINSIVEVGSGIGLLTSAFLKFKKTLKYIIIDIPPALYISQSYLEASGYKILGYREVIKLKNLKDINIDEYQVICIPSWKIDLLKDNKFDLFINHGSFQEMEPEIVKNYLEKISPQISKYIYLENGKKGHALGKKGNFGVLEKTTREHYLTFLKDNFKIKIERDHEYIYGTDKGAFEIVFDRK